MVLILFLKVIAAQGSMYCINSLGFTNHLKKMIHDTNATFPQNLQWKTSIGGTLTIPCNDFCGYLGTKDEWTLCRSKFGITYEYNVTNEICKRNFIHFVRIQPNLIFTTLAKAEATKRSHSFYRITIIVLKTSRRKKNFIVVWFQWIHLR